MSQTIDRIGLWKAELLDFGVTTTNKRGLPQFVGKFQMLQLFNDTTEQWEDVTDWDFVDIAYLVLTTENATGQIVKCLNYDQLIKALGWDGDSYTSLANGDWKGKIVQLRTTEDTYNDATSYKITWIDETDAAIGLRKLDAKEVANLDQKFNVGQPKTPAKPVSAPKSTSKAAPKVAPKVAPEAIEEVAPCTEDTAYTACVAANATLGDTAVPGEVLDDYWIAAVQEIAKDPDTVTSEEWAKIRDTVLTDINIPF